MANSFSFKDNTQEFLSLFASAKERGLEAIGMTAERHAKKLTPVDTGRLRNSIAHAVDGDAAYIGTNVEYAPYVELGAQGREPVHMLQKAASEHSSEYKRLMEASLKNG
jgi:phage gpG-like protein